MSFPEADLSRVKTFSISGRKSKVQIANLAKVVSGQANIAEFLASFPKILKAQDLDYLVGQIIAARKKKRALLWMFGAHVIKCGLSPVLIDLMEKGFITHLATNGAGAIHDLELAFWGKTSEEVERGLEKGKFGMVKETADKFNAASQVAEDEEIGLGEALGLKILHEKGKFRQHSILAAARKMNIPATVHVAIGTDIVHQHPTFKPAETGQATYRDFKILCHSLKGLARGGVAVHIGSAVMLPEVFLKALSVARNIYGRIEGFTAANFDMNVHYRPSLNILQRPTAGSGQGLNFVGHHEIMIPLLAAALKSKKA